MPGFNDNERTAGEIARTFDDSRVRHFYDAFPAHVAGKAFAKGIIKEGRGPAWDIYFFYKKSVAWADGPPSPTEWMHQLSGGKRADAKHFHTGEDLVNALHEAMHAATGDECASP